MNVIESYFRFIERLPILISESSIEILQDTSLIFSGPKYFIVFFWGLSIFTLFLFLGLYGIYETFRSK